MSIRRDRQGTWQIGGKEANELLNSTIDYQKLFQDCLKDPSIRFIQYKPKTTTKESVWTMDIMDLLIKDKK